jgi:hypothetical protein
MQTGLTGCAVNMAPEERKNKVLEKTPPHPLVSDLRKGRY